MKPLLIIDLDGTVLDDHKRLYPQFLGILPELKRKYEILVASGRSKYSVEKYLDLMKLPHRYVSFEGAYVVWNSDLLLDKPFTKETVDELLRRYGHLPTVLFYLHKVLPNDRFVREFSEYLARWSADQIGEEDTGIYKVVFAKRDDGQNPDPKEMDGTVFVYRRKGTNHIFYDIAPGTTKVEGVRLVLKHVGVDPKKCVAVGDYYNDVGLFRMCGLSVAVPNAPLEVKREAHMVGWIWEEPVKRAILNYL
ncbi:MAG: HAD-IIB family hydrolase [Thermotogae bacterium]|nr:HAD-IIB family hydrolase [Thermotogota bacterium]